MAEGEDAVLFLFCYALYPPKFMRLESMIFCALHNIDTEFCH
jgi:hypothetical protein